MFLQFIVGAILIIITVLVHAFVLDGLIKFLERFSPLCRRKFFKHYKVILITITVFGVFCANVVQIWVWAAAFLFLEAEPIQTFEEALYFSTSSFTTAGYGDLVLSKEWRLMGSFEAANGMILFGWSTAFIFDVVSKLYKKDDFKAR